MIYCAVIGCQGACPICKLGQERDRYRNALEEIRRLGDVYEIGTVAKKALEICACGERKCQHFSSEGNKSQ